MTITRLINKCRKPELFFSVLVLLLVAASPAHATADASYVAENMGSSLRNFPQLLAVVSYIAGLLLGVTGVLKLKAHVDHPDNVPLRSAIIRFAVGGGLFALPMLAEAAINTITGGDIGATDFVGSINTLFSGTGLSGDDGDFNDILENIATSVRNIPQLLAVGSYVLGLVLCVWGLLKIKDHVEDPGSTPIREGLIRMITGGSLLSLPFLFTVVYTTINGGVAGGIESADALNYTTTDVTAACGGGGDDMAQLVCNFAMSTGNFPLFLGVMSYIFGIAMAVWGVLKLRDHVIDPRQTSLWDAVTRFVVAGALLALPTILDMIVMTAVAQDGLNSMADADYTGFTGATTADGLDAMMVGFMDNVFDPLQGVFKWFSFVAGVIFVLIGISRLLKSAQDGPRGPGGIGTIMTFLTGGILISMDSLMNAFSTSLFGDSTTDTQAELAYTTGMEPDEIEHVHAVISAILQFMIVLGLISFIRGFFIIRSVAEGNSQASMMAGITHLIGGALAVNLGPLLNAVQETLGLDGFGVQFT